MDIITATIRAYDETTHTATVQPAGSSAYLTAVPVAHHVTAAQMVIGKSCAVIIFDDTDITNTCIVAVWGGTPP